MFYAIFTKANNFCDFLLDSLYDIFIPNVSWFKGKKLHLKE